jgi:hypothetical protein
VRLHILCALVGLAFAAFIAGPAQADSIVYLKGGQVWIANADGSGARQFTVNSFHWAWPSEADDGTVVVAGGDGHGPYGDAGSDIYRFQPDGNQIGGAIPTPGTYYDLNCPTTAPWSVRVAPDAARIAYSTMLCSTSTPTTLWTPSTATGLDWPNQNNGVGTQDYQQPAWIDGTHFTVSHVGVTATTSQARWFVQDTALQSFDSGSAWNEDTMAGTGAQGVISRQGTTFAVFEDDAAGYTDGAPRNVKIWLYTSSNLANASTNGWSLQCKATLDASRTTKPFYASPSFAPDGSKLLWADDDGVEIASLSNLAADGAGNCTSVSAHLFVAGGSEPFYAKGNLAPAATNPVQPGGTSPTTGTPQPTQDTGTSTGTTAPTATTPAPTAVARKLIAKLRLLTKKPRSRHKLVFDAAKSVPGTSRIVSYSWSFGDKKKGKGRKVVHTFKKRGKYTVTLTIRDAGGHKATARLLLRVKH